MLECLQRLNARSEPGKPLPNELFSLLIRAWRAVALAASTAVVATAEVSFASESPGGSSSPSAASIQRELQPLRGLQLRPPLVQYALAREYHLLPAVDVPPGPKWHLLAEQAVQLVRGLLSGAPLTTAQVQLLGGAALPEAICDGCEKMLATHRCWPCGHAFRCGVCAPSSVGNATGKSPGCSCTRCGSACESTSRIYPPSSSLLFCDLHEVLVVVLAVLAPQTPIDATAIAQLLSIAAAAQAILLACEPLPSHSDVALPAADSNSLAMHSSLVDFIEDWRRRLSGLLAMPIAPNAATGIALASHVRSIVDRFRSYADAVLTHLWLSPPSACGTWRLPSALDILSSREGARVIVGWAEAAATRSACNFEKGRDSAQLGSSSLQFHVAQMHPAARSFLEAAWSAGARATAWRVAPSLATLPALYIHRMPKDFLTLSAVLHGRPCAACGKPPHETALCLLCGTILCAGFLSRRGPPMGGLDGRTCEVACGAHARSCGAGSCPFYMVHDGRVLLLDGGQASYFPSIYLDEHGEEDHNLKRGKPLYFNPRRAEALHQLWLTHRVPIEVARTHEIRIA